MIEREHRWRGAPDIGRTLALVQGAYFLVTGIWALVSIGTFQKVTGPKTDLWLVKTVGVLVGVIGAVLGWAGMRERVTASERLLAVGSAAGLTAIDVIYVLRGRISPVYLLDAALEVGLIAGWIAEIMQGTRQSDEGAPQAAWQPAGEQPIGEGYYISTFEQGAD